MRIPSFFNRFALPKAVLAWSREKLPQTLEEAKARAKAILKAFHELAASGRWELAAGWRGELLALAESQPQRPELPLAYAKTTKRILKISRREEQIQLVARLSLEIQALAAHYPGNPEIAAWQMDTLLVFIRGLTQTEALDALLFSREARLIANAYPRHAGIANNWGRILAIVIKLHSQSMGEEDEAPSSGQLICLDAAVAEYGEAEALAKSLPDNLELVKIQSEAALQICLAFASTGQPAEARYWLEETRKLCERFPELEDAAFSYLYSLGTMLRSLQAGEDDQEAERLCRLTNMVGQGVLAGNVRLLKERLAARVDLINYCAQGGLTEKAEGVLAELEKLTAELPPDERSLFFVTGNCNLLLAYRYADMLPEAEKIYAKVWDMAGNEPGPRNIVSLAQAGLGLVEEYLGRESLDLAEKTLNRLWDLSRRLSLADTELGAELEEWRERLRQARKAFRQLERSPDRGFAGWLRRGLAFLRRSREEETDWRPEAARAAEEAFAAANNLSNRLSASLEAGAWARAEKAYLLIRSLAERFPRSQEIGLVQVEAVMCLHQASAETWNGFRTGKLYREARDICARFRGVPVFVQADFSACVQQHAYLVRANRVASAEKMLTELRQLAASHSGDAKIASGLMDAVYLQFAKYGASGQLDRAWPLYEEILQAHERGGNPDAAETLEFATLDLGDFFIEQRLEEEAQRLLRLLAEAHQRHPGGRQVEAMLNALMDKLTLAGLNPSKSEGQGRTADWASLTDRYGLN